MKLDLASASDNLKVSVPDSGKSVATNSETSESSGFMSQLSALLGGPDESSHKAQTNAAQQSTVTDETAKPSSPTVNNDSVAHESVDELLESDQNLETVKSTTSTGEGDAVKQKTDSTLDGEEASKVLAASEVVSREAKAKQVMSESDELLGRLNESNSALQTKESLRQQDVAAPATVVASGKELPHENEPSSVKPGLVSIAAVSSHSPLTDKSLGMPNEALESTHSHQTHSAMAPELSDINGQVVEAEHVQEQPQKSAVTDELTSAQPLNASSSEELSELETQVGQKAEAQQPVITQSSLAAQDSSNTQVQTEEVGSEPTAIPWGQSPKEAGHVSQQASDVKLNSERSLAAAQSASVAAVVPSSPPSALATSPTAVSLQAMDAKMGTDASLASAPVVPANPSASNSALQASLAATSVMATKGDKKEASHLGPQDLTAANGVTSSAPTAQATRAEVNTAQGSVVISQAMSPEQMAEKANERVQVMLSKNLKNIDIRLDPPELGRMQIRMNMNGDTTTVHFTVANNQARDVVEQAMPRLREMLAQQGLQLGDTSVQQQSAGQQQGRFAQQGNGDGHSNTHGDGWDGDESTPETSMNLNVDTKQDGISFYA
ncbi:flagellar hook-length control protein FliK [Vibrio astriarenae]|uniref:flagellar hook-length control protein FliK n=1 Tax=Vibrio astriarenae TaxID=1481923 RepID=UPI003736EAD4